MTQLPKQPRPYLFCCCFLALTLWLALGCRGGEELKRDLQDPLSVEPHTRTTTVYTVQVGDTLTSIARVLGTSRMQLERLNPGIVNDQLHVGMRLRVPGGKPAIREVNTPPPLVEGDSGWQ